MLFPQAATVGPHCDALSPNDTWRSPRWLLRAARSTAAVAAAAAAAAAATAAASVCELERPLKSGASSSSKQVIVQLSLRLLFSDTCTVCKLARQRQL